MNAVKILEELKQLDYGVSKSYLSGKQWDWLIDSFAEMKLKKEKNNGKKHN